MRQRTRITNRRLLILAIVLLAAQLVVDVVPGPFGADCYTYLTLGDPIEPICERQSWWPFAGDVQIRTAP